MTANTNPLLTLEYAIRPEGTRFIRKSCETRHEAVGLAAVWGRVNDKTYTVEPVTWVNLEDM